MTQIFAHSQETLGVLGVDDDAMGGHLERGLQGAFGSIDEEQVFQTPAASNGGDDLSTKL